MDDLEVHHIRSNLNKLIKLTDCNPELISELHKDILTDYEVQSISSETTRIGKASALYEVAFRKVGGYKALIQAFRKTKQTGALSILLEKTSPYPSLEGDVHDLSLEEQPLSTKSIKPRRYDARTEPINTVNSIQARNPNTKRASSKPETKTQCTDGKARPRCSVCDKTGHNIQTCPHTVTCSACGKRGHNKLGCTDIKRCSICDRPGHNKRTCPSK